VARGFTKAGHQGNPDDARAARILLKDFVNGKLIYCHPPPGVDAGTFNHGNYTIEPIIEKSFNPHARAVEDETERMDEGFFVEQNPRAMTKAGVFGGRNKQYTFQRSVGDDGRVLSAGDKDKMNGIPAGKKHFKGYRG
jgi:large subunit GTPase 1